MSKYGMPYKGSKNAIADNLMDVLPSGNRFCDLFAGGGAMTECALLSKKYKDVLYRDLNDKIVELFHDAVSGKYTEEKFTPEFIDRKTFFAEKDNDGYICVIFSFGNNQQNYIYAEKDIPVKRSLHNYIVYGVWDDNMDELFGKEPQGMPPATGHNYQERRSVFRKVYPNYLNGLERTQHLETLSRLTRLEHLGRLTRLEIESGSYDSFRYADGDVVYCDIPYIGSQRDYATGKFDHDRFYDWAYHQDYPVYISSTQCDDKRFVSLYEIYKRNGVSPLARNNMMREQVFIQDKMVGEYFNQRWGLYTPRGDF